MVVHGEAAAAHGAGGLFLVIYSLARITVEFWRLPDEHLSYLAGGWVTMGMLLSLPMLLIGATLHVHGLPAP